MGGTKQGLGEIRDRLKLVANPVQLLEGIFAYAPVALQIYKPDGHCLLTNRAFRELFGSEPPPEYNILRDEVAREQGFLELIHRAFAGEVVEIPPVWYDARELRHVTVLEGKRVAVGCTVFPLPDSSGTVAHIALVFKDVTAEMLAREHAEDAARRAEESLALLDTLLQTAPVGLGFLDCELRYLRINDTLAEINGAAPQAHIGRTLHEMLPQLAPVVEGYYRDVLVTGRPIVNLEVTGETRGDPGVQRVWLVSYYPVRTASGAIVGIGNAVTDITERKRLERELSERVQELAIADKRKDEFLAVLGHELRNPLAPIVTALSLFKSGKLDGDAERRALAVIQRQVKQMTRLVDDLLDVARITRGKIELRYESVSLQDIVARVTETVRPSLDARGQRLALELPEEAISLRADPARLEQVLCNLIGNAAKFTAPGGDITLRAELGQGEVVVTVQDTGVGMTPEALGQIFEPFVRCGEQHGARDGLGIGLTITRRLVQLHGGVIEASSAGPGRGSTFTFRLPSAAAPAVPSARPEPAPVEQPLGRRILVVDDNVDAAMLLGELLTHQGQQVRVVHDGGSALAEYEREEPDIVLLDLGLPDIDGFEVARRLRRRASSESLQIIAVTGFGQPADRRRSREAGFDHHLVKPVDVQRLMELLRDSGTPTKGLRQSRVTGHKRAPER